jgi:site-specific DNA recombinase
MRADLIAAIYARKSTEQNGVADEARSVSREIEHARAYAVSRGWSVDASHIYEDDAVSGAEFTKRPGYMRLLNALKPRTPFDVLIVSEVSRLGREQFEVGYGLKQLAQAGVKVYSYLDGREIAMESATDKFLLSAVNFAAEIEREKARQRVSDTMLRKARSGHVCGGACFGYKNVEIKGLDGRRSHVDRELHPQEAPVVQRIFEMRADGKGLKRIAKTLNDQGVPAPRPQ